MPIKSDSPFSSPEEVLRYCVQCGKKVIPYMLTESGMSNYRHQYRPGEAADGLENAIDVSTYRCACSKHPLLAPSKDITSLHCPSCKRFINMTPNCGYCGADTGWGSRTG